MVGERRNRIGALLAALALAGCGAGQGAGKGAGAAEQAPPEKPSAIERAPLDVGLEALAQSRYADAERALRSALRAPKNPEEHALALGALAETLLATGQRAEIRELVRKTPTELTSTRLLLAAAEGLRQDGKLDQALEVLGKAGRPESDAAALERALLRGELLLEQGDRAGAEEPLLSIIEAYNDERIAPTDGRTLAVVGRAAHLLRSPHDANDAFDEAEEAQPNDLRTLLWRAELFLEKYDLAKAEEVLKEVLAAAPHHPDALVAMAEVRLGQALDFDEAERLARAALATNPKHPRAHFVLAGIALRDEDVPGAERHVQSGLTQNPRNLELMSLGAAARFLAEDPQGFEAAVQRVLDLNPSFTRLFQIVGEFADWEHRYDEIVRLMRRAVRIDPEDGRARAQLGLNLIRAGQDAAGVVELRRAFQSDPFNARVYNTLELYEKIIPRDYEQVRSGHFLVRYPKRQRALLERYVPELLERAYRTMAAHYGFEPEGPIGVEIYEKREQFAVRTSGLPQTGIQGVCFGRTLATMSLPDEPANLGMTLWHELAHVFHIQLSKSRVPRWFTEGVAELETARQRPEWSRELDPQLFEALRAGRVPPVAQLSRAFTRAEHMEDVATAYFTSNRVAEFLADRHGMPKLAGMLRAWGSGQSATEVLSGVLGQSPEEVDREFRTQLGKELARFRAQFVPRRFRGSIEERKEAADKRPKDPDAQLSFALALQEAGELEAAEKRLRAVVDAHPKHADALFALARLETAGGAFDSARERLEALVAGGFDGYEPRLLLGKLALRSKDSTRAEAHFSAAHRFDPRAAEPLARLAELRRDTGDADGELAALRLLAPLEEHAGPVHRRLLELLVERSLWSEAVQAGEAALWAQLDDLRIHSLYARALEHSGQSARALFEWETATLCPASPAERALAYRELSAAYERRGRRREALAAEERAKQLETAPGAPSPSG